MRNISISYYDPYQLFVTINGDGYVNSAYAYYGLYYVNKWTINATSNILYSNTGGYCFGIFVDVSNTLYCSITDLHEVIKIWLGDSTNTWTTVAGTGSLGSTASMLYYPKGIFVDINFNLYVADCYNSRIQLFQLGQSNALTVAGYGASGTITLSYPTGVVLDADKYLFIVDCYNHRIVASGPNGFRCLVGCSGGGSASNQLLYPWSIAFDSYGNIFVADTNNNRIQKFILATNSCGNYNPD
jgi:sugar lactone lactonase YvrE